MDEKKTDKLEQTVRATIVRGIEAGSVDAGVMVAMRPVKAGTFDYAMGKLKLPGTREAIAFVDPREEEAFDTYESATRFDRDKIEEYETIMGVVAEYKDSLVSESTKIEVTACKSILESMKEEYR